MEALVISCNSYWVWSGMPRYAEPSPKKCQYLWKRLSYFVYLLHLVTHQWKLQRFSYHVILVWYGLACPKFSEISCQYLQKWYSDFVDFLHLVFCILSDIH